MTGTIPDDLVNSIQFSESRLRDYAKRHRCSTRLRRLTWLRFLNRAVEVAKDASGRALAGISCSQTHIVYLDANVPIEDFLPSRKANPASAAQEIVMAGKSEKKRKKLKIVRYERSMIILVDDGGQEYEAEQ